jgi:hypothetical protein
MLKKNLIWNRFLIKPIMKTLLLLGDYLAGSFYKVTAKGEGHRNNTY